MIDSTLLATARAAFAALDCTDENDQIAALEAERERIAGAIANADKRIRELSAEIATWVRANPSSAIADALLDNAEPSIAATAAPGRDALIDERAKLNGGIAELRRRDSEVYNEIRNIQVKTRARAGTSAVPVIAAWLEDALSAAQRLRECYAALDAISGATGAGTRERDRVGLAVARITGTDCLLRHGPIPVDAATLDMLRALDGKGPALPFGVRVTTTTPDDLATSALIFGAIAGMRQAA